MKKVRIKKVHSHSIGDYYIIQKKHFFFGWYNATTLDCPKPLRLMCFVSDVFYSLKDAQDAIGYYDGSKKSSEII